MPDVLPEFTCYPHEVGMHRQDVRFGPRHQIGGV